MSVSEEDRATILNVGQAISIQFNHLSNDQDRFKAMEVCVYATICYCHTNSRPKFTEQFKLDLKSLRIAFQLIHASQDVHVRHYGMSVLEHHFKHSWNLNNALSPKQKDSIKSTLLTYLSLVCCLI